MVAKTKTITMICLVLVLIASSSGCIDQIIGNPATKAAAEIENAINTADFNSEQWRAQLDKLATKLETLESNAAQDVKDIEGKTVADTGMEAMCGVDFIRERTRQDLQRVADKLRGKRTTPPLPSFCGVVPPGLDMNHRQDFVYFYGYDLKLRDRDPLNPSRYIETKNVKTFLTYDGGEIQLDQWTDIQNHYLLSVKTSANDDIPLCNKANRHIVLKSNDGVELSSIGVSKLTCPAPPPGPTPEPEKNFVPGTLVEVFGNSFPAPDGHRYDKEYGGACDAGYHRSNYYVYSSGKSGLGGADCTFNNWVGDDESMCKISVHYWHDASTNAKCNIGIKEAGNVQPTPPAPPCPCW